MKDLSAQRVGDQALLRWTTPTRTTDDAEIAGPRSSMTAEICREVGPKPSAPAARLSACVPVRRLPVAPGPSEVADTLPATLQSDPLTLLTYRVQIFNSTGHSAGQSTEAFVAAGSTPQQISGLEATSSEQGTVLEWASKPAPESDSPGNVAFDRLDLSATSPAHQSVKTPVSRPFGKSKPATQPVPAKEDPAEVHLLAADTVAAAKPGTAGTVDTTILMGHTYSYSAQRVRSVTLNGHRLELRSQPSPATTVVVKDTFAPGTPTGLATISGPAKAYEDAAKGGHAQAGGPAAPYPGVPYVDLSWEPNGEADLAGYRVYRQLARPDGSPQGPLGRLTASPIAAPAYRDLAVRPGQGYIYSVTAVDAAGNESAPSAKALEVVPPDSGESPR